MDSNAISKFFSELRLSRRRAVTHGGAGVAGALITGGLAPTAGLAQGATPVTGENVEFLFVQSFGGGSIVPASGDGTYTLTLEQGLGETVFFADRPGREVGAVTTSEFITVFDETGADPPNAALVSGDTVLVFELTGVTYDEGAGALTYEATSIEADAVDIKVDEGISDIPAEETSLGTSHLFIDSIDHCCDPIHRPWCC